MALNTLMVPFLKDESPLISIKINETLIPINPHCPLIEQVLVLRSLG